MTKIESLVTNVVSHLMFSGIRIIPPQKSVSTISLIRLPQPCRHERILTPINGRSSLLPWIIKDEIDFRSPGPREGCLFAEEGGWAFLLIDSIRVPVQGKALGFEVPVLLEGCTEVVPSQ